MRQLPGDEFLRNQAQPILVLRVGEQVLAIRPERLVRVHAAAVDAGNRLGHEGGIDAVVLGDGFQRLAQGDGVIGGAQRQVIFDVDLMLPNSHFVMQRFDGDAKALQCGDHLASDGMRQVDVGIEVAGLVVRG